MWVFLHSRISAIISMVQIKYFFVFSRIFDTSLCKFMILKIVSVKKEQPLILKRQFYFATCLDIFCWRMTVAWWIGDNFLWNTGEERVKWGFRKYHLVICFTVMKQLFATTKHFIEIGIGVDSFVTQQCNCIILSFIIATESHGFGFH